MFRMNLQVGDKNLKSFSYLWYIPLEKLTFYEKGRRTISCPIRWIHYWIMSITHSAYHSAGDVNEWTCNSPTLHLSNSPPHSVILMIAWSVHSCQSMLFTSHYEHDITSLHYKLRETYCLPKFKYCTITCE